MSRILLILAIACSFFFVACNKSDDAPTFDFTTTGPKDVDFDAYGHNTFDVTATPKDGITSKETVTLSVPNLPAGVSVTIQPNGRSLPFTATVTFSLGSGAVAGTYPLAVVFTSGSGQKEHPFNLRVSTPNGWTVGSKSFRSSGFATNFISGYTAISASSGDNGGGLFNASVKGRLPATDGSYTYNLYSSADTAKTMLLSVYASGMGDFTNVDVTDRKTATLTVSGGKYALSFPATTCTNGTETAQVTASLRE